MNSAIIIAIYFITNINLIKPEVVNKTLQSASSELVDLCEIPEQRGACIPGETDFFYYNPSTKRCEIYEDDVCGKSPNRFSTFDECENRCQQYVDLCESPAKVLNCNDKVANRFFYDKERNECHGSADNTVCSHSKNSFSSLEDCENKCLIRTHRCNITEIAGDCRANQADIYHFNVKTKKCQRFSDGKCGMNQNRFTSVDECEEQCKEMMDICKIKPESGDCNESDSLKYYFNEKYHKCMEFNEGKCGTNLNSFASVKECESKCKVKKDRCEIKPKSTKCDAENNFRYYYHEDYNKCMKFKNKRCGHTENRFQTKSKCEFNCLLDKDVCQVKPLSGKCSGKNQHVYYYHSGYNQCLKFLKKQCGHSDNRFRSRKECENRCLMEKSACEIKPMSGECDPKDKCQFYYNLGQNKCAKFTKNKCGRTTNKFKSQEECETKCKKNICTIEPKFRDCEEENEFGYYFDIDSTTCRRVMKHQCLTSANKFTSMEDCISQCSK